MELGLSLQPGDGIAVLPVGILRPEPAVRIGRLGGAASLTVVGAPTDLRRLADALAEAASRAEE